MLWDGPPRTHPPGVGDRLKFEGFVGHSRVFAWILLGSLNCILKKHPQGPSRHANDARAQPVKSRKALSCVLGSRHDFDSQPPVGLIGLYYPWELLLRVPSLQIG